MAFRALSDILPGVLARAEAMQGFQALLNRCECAIARKELILAAWERGAIGDDDTRLLIEAYGLETV